MAFITLSGTLQDSLGNIVAGAKLKFTAIRTSEEVLNTLSAEFLTDSSGQYNSSLNFGVYHLSIKLANESAYQAVASNIVVNNVNQSGTIPALIKSQQEIQSIDQQLIDLFFQYKTEAAASANIATTKASEASASATSAADSANIATIKASEASTSATSATNSAAIATTKASEASASATSASNSAAIATTKANEASASAAEALASKEIAELSAESATNSAENAELSASEASASATSAESNAATAITKANEAEDSATTATTKASEASASATSAAASATTATTKASEASASAAEALASKEAAEAAATVATGALIEAGPVDLSSGVAPTPLKDSHNNNLSCFWKVTVAGIVNGVDYAVNDSIVYSKILDSYYKVDNTEAVTSVNGMQGAVVITKATIGLSNVDNTSDANKPISNATQTVLDQKAPISHVGATGGAHGTATTSTAGFMSASDKSKLDNIASGANNYVHPTSGVSAGTYKSVTVDINGHVTSGSNPTTLAGYGITDALSLNGGTINGNLTVSGVMHSNQVVANVDIIVSGIGGISNNGGYFRQFSNDHLFIDAAQGRGFYAGNNFTYNGTWAKRDAAHPSAMIAVESGSLCPRFLRSDAGNGSATQYAYDIYHTGYNPTAAAVGAPALVNNTIEIPSLNGGSTGCVKIQGSGDDTEAWMLTRPNSDSSHRGIGINHGSGPVYWTGSAKYYLLHSGANNLRNGSDWGAGFLSSGTSGKPWIAGYFGDAAGTGGRVVLGTLNGYATIGAHVAGLTAWDKLVINGGAGGNESVYIGMLADASSGSGNLFVGNDIEANYIRIRNSVPNDSRYVVNKGYVDGTFAKLAYRGDWADKGIHTQTAAGLAWQYYGNGHQIIDASAGSYEGISFSRTDAQSAWDVVNGPTLVGWNGSNTYGVRVDRCRRADTADTASTSGRITGTVATIGQDLTIHGKRAVVGVGDANQLVINYGNDWGSVNIVGNTSYGSLTGGRIIPTGSGNMYSGLAIEVLGNGPTNTVFPGIGFHQPGLFAGSIQLRNADQFWFYNPDASTRIDIVARQFYANGNINIEGSSSLLFSSYGGGWYMVDDVWIRTANNKKIYSGNSSYDAIHTAGGILASGSVTGNGGVYDGGNRVFSANYHPYLVYDYAATATTLWTGSSSSHPSTIALSAPLSAFNRYRFEGVNSGATIAWSVTITKDELIALSATGLLVYIASGTYSYTFNSFSISATSLSRNTSANCFLTKIVGLY